MHYHIITTSNLYGSKYWRVTSAAINLAPDALSAWHRQQEAISADDYIHTGMSIHSEQLTPIAMFNAREALPPQCSPDHRLSYERVRVELHREHRNAAKCFSCDQYERDYAARRAAVTA